MKVLFSLSILMFGSAAMAASATTPSKELFERLVPSGEPNVFIAEEVRQDHQQVRRVQVRCRMTSPLDTRLVNAKDRELVAMSAEQKERYLSFAALSARARRRSASAVERARAGDELCREWSRFEGTFGRQDIMKAPAEPCANLSKAKDGNFEIWANWIDVERDTDTLANTADGELIIVDALTNRTREAQLGLGRTLVLSCAKPTRCGSSPSVDKDARLSVESFDEATSQFILVTDRGTRLTLICGKVPLSPRERDDCLSSLTDPPVSLRTRWQCEDGKVLSASAASTGEAPKPRATDR